MLRVEGLGIRVGFGPADSVGFAREQVEEHVSQPLIHCIWRARIEFGV